ncbi:SdiA-regulated domain-containing protein [Pseudomonas sp. NyZ704]|nr:SdiA-regulated domain-containing protein [Pseudomonas sp. NyZ704]
MHQISYHQKPSSLKMVGLRIPRPQASTVLGTLLLLALIVLADYKEWDRRLYFHLKTTLSAAETRAPGVWLSDYQVVTQGKSIAGIDRNLSSIVHDWDADRLLAVSNGPAYLVSLDRSGNTLATYPLQGFGDIEAITYLGAGLLVLVEERAHRLNFVRLPETPGPISVDQAQHFSLGINLSGNKGYEGIAFDPRSDRLFIVKERDPMQLLVITGLVASLGTGLEIDIADLTTWIDGYFGTDLSSVHFDQQTGHLLLLSEESRLVVELNTVGELVSYRSFSSWTSDLNQSAPRPEGITLDAQGNMFMVSEPNLFYSFAKPSETQSVTPGTHETTHSELQ